ncbi:oligogalacturonate lyase family protein [Terriglobus sp. RCC_193]|uniref:oligogalacturonate lyase family protein n=1 Tax=Terriglobus sp. RCC_193 TaxID=3239218 RepID=UPI0035268A6C
MRNKAIVASLALVCCAVATAQTAVPPKTWVDKDTGHRVYRLTDEPNSSGFYFNNNAYSPDGRWMVYTAPDGVHALELTTRKTRLLVANPPRNGTGPSTNYRTIVVGHKTNSVFLSRFDAEAKGTILFKADLESGQLTRLAALPARGSVASINADETLGVGTYDETEQGAQQEYNRPAVVPRGAGSPAAVPGGLVQPEGKGEMMERRLAARIPVVLYTVDLRTGKVRELLHSTDWIGHMLFSPTDPTLLMYCHEGPWQKVDRIWTIRTDGTQNTLMHKRTMFMEIAGHEFWGLDGETIWYDWQPAKGEDFWLAGINLQTHKRVAYHMQRNEWSIHFNLTQDMDLFAGDGGDPGQVAKAPDGEWIYLFHPQWVKDQGGIDQPDFTKPGFFQAERLVNMSRHNYRLEPNVRFSPNKKLVLFTSNIFGASYVFGVEVAKADNALDVESTPELAARFRPSAPAK